MRVLNRSLIVLVTAAYVIGVMWLIVHFFGPWEWWVFVIAFLAVLCNEIHVWYRARPFSRKPYLIYSRHDAQ